MQSMIEQVHAFCVEVAQDMLVSEGTEVRSFLVFAWEDEQEKGTLGELSLMDGAIFHGDQSSLGKDILMSLVSRLLSGDSKALAMLGGGES